MGEIQVQNKLFQTKNLTPLILIKPICCCFTDHWDKNINFTDFNYTLLKIELKVHGALQRIEIQQHEYMV